MPRISQVPSISQSVRDALARGASDVELDDLPKMQKLTAENLTANVQAINSGISDERTRYVNQRLVHHMHEFVREVSLTTEEWMSAIQFLTKTGQTCTDLRQEFILLSDAYGVSALVDIINHPKPPGASESTVLGPFFVDEAQTIANGESIVSDGVNGDLMVVRGRVRNLRGEPIQNCLIDTWEANDTGYYDTQLGESYEADCRGRLYTDAEGRYMFRAIRPVAYPIPDDGPVGQLLQSFNRHVFRPAHLHMKFQAAGYEDLVTSLYFKGDIFLTSDAVFGVKSSLVVEPTLITDPAKAKELGLPSAPVILLEYDWVLTTPADRPSQ